MGIYVKNIVVRATTQRRGAILYIRSKKIGKHWKNTY